MLGVESTQKTVLTTFEEFKTEMTNDIYASSSNYDQLKTQVEELALNEKSAGEDITTIKSKLEQLEQLSESLKSSGEDLPGLKTKVNSLEEENESIRAALEDSQQSINDKMTSQVDKLTSAMENKTASINTEFQAKIADANKELHRQSDLLTAFIKTEVKKLNDSMES